MIGGSLSGFVTAINKTGGEPHQLFDVVQKWSDFLLRNAATLDALFDNFELEKYTYVHAAILRAKYRSQLSLDKEVLINQTQSLFERFNPEHARRISSYIRTISREFTNHMIRWGMAFRAIQPITVAIRRMQSSPEQLTSLHCDLCQLSLTAKLFTPVLPILETDILEVDKNSALVDAKDYLLYFYYGGMIYAALKNWERALHFFELCMIIPSVSVSCILIEAAKKVILVSLICNGKFTTAFDMSTTLSVSSKPWKRYCQPYLSLAAMFQKNEPNALKDVMDAHQGLFAADHNSGLIKQVVRSHVKFRIHSLTKTFMTLSLTDVANHIRLSNASEAERYLLEMIESKAIFARIDQRSGTVHFLDDPEQYNSMDMLLTLQKKMDDCMRLEKHMMRVSDQLMVNPNYVKRITELEKKPAHSSVHY